MPTGMICSGWVKQSPQWNFRHIDVDLDAYIQDALDAIEYAIGDTTTKWGAERAKNGHPAPFPLNISRLEMKISDLCIGSVMRKSIRRCPPNILT